jgi:hypothetical protein
MRERKKEMTKKIMEKIFDKKKELIEIIHAYLL